MNGLGNVQSHGREELRINQNFKQGQPLPDCFYSDGEFKRESYVLGENGILNSEHVKMEGTFL